MKSKYLTIVISTIALAGISLADPASDQILIKMTVRSEKMVDGKIGLVDISRRRAGLLIGRT